MAKATRRRQPAARPRANATKKAPRRRKPSKLATKNLKEDASAHVQPLDDPRKSNLSNPVQAMATTNDQSANYVPRDFNTMKTIQEVGDIVLRNAPASAGDWRQSLPLEKRFQVCQYLYSKFFGKNLSSTITVISTNITPVNLNYAFECENEFQPQCSIQV